MSQCAQKESIVNICSMYMYINMICMRIKRTMTIIFVQAIPHNATVITSVAHIAVLKLITCHTDSFQKLSELLKEGPNI